LIGLRGGPAASLAPKCISPQLAAVYTNIYNIHSALFTPTKANAQHRMTARVSHIENHRALVLLQRHVCVYVCTSSVFPTASTTTTIIIIIIIIIITNRKQLDAIAIPIARPARDPVVVLIAQLRVLAIHRGEQAVAAAGVAVERAAPARDPVAGACPPTSARTRISRRNPCRCSRTSTAWLPPPLPPCRGPAPALARAARARDRRRRRRVLVAPRAEARRRIWFRKKSERRRRRPERARQA
jgi:hypothetical protein